MHSGGQKWNYVVCAKGHAFLGPRCNSEPSAIRHTFRRMILRNHVMKVIMDILEVKNEIYIVPWPRTWVFELSVPPGVNKVSLVLQNDSPSEELMVSLILKSWKMKSTQLLPWCMNFHTLGEFQSWWTFGIVKVFKAACSQTNYSHR